MKAFITTLSILLALAAGGCGGSSAGIAITGPAINVEGSLGMVHVNLPQWSLQLVASNGKQLAPGTYVTGTPNEAAGIGGISVTGPGGTCEDAHSTVTIYQVALNAPSHLVRNVR